MENELKDQTYLQLSRSRILPRWGSEGQFSGCDTVQTLPPTFLKASESKNGVLVMCLNKKKALMRTNLKNQMIYL